MELTINLPQELAEKLAYIAYKLNIGIDTLAIRVLEEYEAAQKSVQRTGLSPAHMSICPECLGPNGEHSANCSLQPIR